VFAAAVLHAVQESATALQSVSDSIPALACVKVCVRIDLEAVGKNQVCNDFCSRLTCTKKERLERIDHFSSDAFGTRPRRSWRMTVGGGRQPELRVKSCELGGP
jgi:hypothetical protein